jgi:hypothetical protein
MASVCIAWSAHSLNIGLGSLSIAINLIIIITLACLQPVVFITAPNLHMAHPACSSSPIHSHSMVIVFSENIKKWIAVKVVRLDSLVLVVGAV